MTAPGAAGGGYELGRPDGAELGPGRLAITFHGELDESNVERLWGQLCAELDQVLAGGAAPCPTAVADLARVRFMASAGLRLLLRLRGHLAAAGVRLVTVAPPGTPCHRLIELTGLRDELGAWPGQGPPGQGGRPRAAGPAEEAGTPDRWP